MTSHSPDHTLAAESTFDDTLGILELPAPDIDARISLRTALERRSSTRSFRREQLPMQAISELLWAGSGINRMMAGGRTVPFRHLPDEVEIYAAFPNGVYRYEALAHRLILRRAIDIRALTGTQDFVRDAPLNLIYVTLKHETASSHTRSIPICSIVSAGSIAQNVALYCAATGLASVVRETLDVAQLANALGLSGIEFPLLAQTVGLPVNT